MNQTESTEYLTSKPSDKVTKETVHYKNRYGLTMAAHFYLPKDMEVTNK